MSTSHILLALFIVMIWGINFIFVKFALTDISPLMLCFLRFALVSIPAIFFIKPPFGSFKMISLYGIFTFALQFLFLFMGMEAGMTAGMASLLLQVQVFFSIFFAVIFLGEKPQISQLLGALISFAGIGTVAMHFDQNVSFEGFLLILIGAASWGFGTTIVKKASHINMLSLVIWGSFISCIPMLLGALIFEGPKNFVTSYQHIDWLDMLAVLYIAYVSTWVGYGAWNWLLTRYTIATVVPFTLLVPVVGMLSSVVFLGESCELWKVISGLLVISGVCISVLAPRFFKAKTIALDTTSSQINISNPSK